MTATKGIYRANLFLNPLFDPSGMHMGAWDQDNSSLMPGDGTFVSDGNTKHLLLPELTVGVGYVFRCMVVEDPDGVANCSIWAENSVQLSNSVRPVDGAILIRFTYRTMNDVQSRNRVLFGKGTYTRPHLELASTYDAAVAGGGACASSRTTPCPGDIPSGGGAR